MSRILATGALAAGRRRRRKSALQPLARLGGEFGLARLDLIGARRSPGAPMASTTSATGAAPSSTIARDAASGSASAASDSTQQAAQAGDRQDGAPQVRQSQQPLGRLRYAGHRRQADHLGDLGCAGSGIELPVSAKRQEALSHSAA